MKIGIYWVDGQPVTSGESPAFPVQIVTSGALDADKYQDVSTIQGWAQYGPALIGSAVGFKDYLCLQREIDTKVIEIAGSDYASFASLSTPQKQIAAAFLPDRLPQAALDAAFPDYDIQGAKVAEFALNARLARIQRIEIARQYFYKALLYQDAIKVVKDISDSLLLAYIGGVRSNLLSGEDGIFDYIDGTSGYNGAGLPAKSFTPKGGLTMRQVCDNLLSILRDGIY